MKELIDKKKLTLVGTESYKTVNSMVKGASLRQFTTPDGKALFQPIIEGSDGVVRFDHVGYRDKEQAYKVIDKYKLGEGSSQIMEVL